LRRISIVPTVFDHRSFRGGKEKQTGGKKFPPVFLVSYLPLLGGLQSQSLPQVHSLPLFIGQFLPVVLQLCFSAANALVQIIAARIDIRIFV
jgi:hypothetical protein